MKLPELKKRFQNKYVVRIVAGVLTIAMVGTGFSVYTVHAEKAGTENAAQTAGSESDSEDELSLSSLLKDNVSVSEKEIDKDETVYLISDANGNVNQTIVSDHLINHDKEKTLKDKSSLKDIENVKGDETFSQSGNDVTWQADGNDIYYQGTSSETAPVTQKVTYYLDGKEISPKDLAGKSGKVTIHFDYTNHSTYTEKVNGEDVTVCVPFAAITGMVLDDSFSNVEVTNGKVSNTGKGNIVIGYALPGLKDSLNLNDKDLDEDINIPESFEVTADVENFSLETAMTVVANAGSLVSADGSSDLSSVDDMIDTLTDASEQLQDGSKELSEGLDTLQNSLKDFSSGMNTLSGGIKSYTDGAKTLGDGITTLKNGMDSLAGSAPALVDGVNQLKAGASQASDGAGQLVAGYEGSSSQTGLVEGAKALADGAAQVASGAAALQDGASQLKTGSESAVAGAGQLVDGIADLQAGTNQVKDGSAQVAKGASDLADGTQKVSDGAASLNRQVGAIAKNAADSLKTLQGAAQAQIDKSFNDSYKESIVPVLAGTGCLPQGDEKVTAQNIGSVIEKVEANKAYIVGALAQAGQDADTAETTYNSVKNGLYTLSGVVQAMNQVNEKLSETGLSEETLSALAQGVNDLADGASQANTGAQGLKDGSAQVDAGVGALQDGETKLKAGADALSTGLAQLDAGVKRLYEGAFTLNAGASQVSSGANTVSSGVQKVYNGTKSLASGISQLDIGLGTVTSKMPELTSGISQLVNGAGQLKTGADTLVSNNDTLNSGASQLVNGTSQIVDGVNKLDEGSHTLADGMVEFNEEGINKIVNAYNGDLKPLANRLQAVIDAGEDYQSYTDLADGANGSVKFIYKLDSIKAEK